MADPKNYVTEIADAIPRTRPREDHITALLNCPPLVKFLEEHGKYEKVIREAVKRLEALSSKLLEGEIPKECAGDAAAEIRDLLAAALEETK